MEVATPDTLLKYQDLASKGDFQIITNAEQETDETVIALNTTKEPFNDPLARQALAYGLDQNELSQISYQGAFPGAAGNFVEGSPYYISKQEAGYPEYNPDKAKQLVAEYDWAQEREAFGSPIAEYQGISFPLADSLTELHAARLLTYHAAHAFDVLEDRKVVHGKVSMAKLFASEMAGRVADRAVQALGGRGYMVENAAARFYRELRVDRIWEGTSEIQRSIISRGVFKRGAAPYLN